MKTILADSEEVALLFMKVPLSVRCVAPPRVITAPVRELTEDNAFLIVIL